MKILLVSDEEDSALWDYYQPGRLKEYDLILSAGDLKAEYLSFLVTMANVPVLYVHGNHDGNYDRFPPEGCECIDDRLVTVNGLRILGLGGCAVYSGEPYQYTERQMRRRVRRLRGKLRRSGGVDILLTHAPARGLGDEEDPAHIGFEALRELIDELQPRWHIHGHVHLRYNGRLERVLHRGDTEIVNACGHYILEI